MGHLALEEFQVFQHAERLADHVWIMTSRWNGLARDTVARQLIRAADSVGANPAEGYGRGTYKDNKRCVHIARGSLSEVRFWLRRAHQRRLLAEQDQRELKQLMGALPKLLNGYLRSLDRRARVAVDSDTVADIE